MSQMVVDYHSFSEPNASTPRLQMEICRAAKLKSEVIILGSG